MSQSNQKVDLRALSAFCMIALGAMFLTNPVTHLLYRGVSDTPFAIAMRGFAAPISMVLFIGSVLGLARLLRDGAERLGLAAAVLTLMGWTAGVRILALGQLESLLRAGIDGVPPDVLGRILQAAPLVWISIVPIGLMFPIGLTILGLALIAVRPVPRPLGAMLVAGAVLFPIGRIPALGWALLSCDLILGASLALIGWRVLHPDRSSDTANGDLSSAVRGVA